MSSSISMNSNSNSNSVDDIGDSGRRRKKKGMGRLGSSIRNVFGGGKKRRKRRKGSRNKNKSGDQQQQQQLRGGGAYSYSDDGSYDSYSYSDSSAGYSELGHHTNATEAQQQEWVNGKGIGNGNHSRSRSRSAGNNDNYDEEDDGFDVGDIPDERILAAIPNRTNSAGGRGFSLSMIAENEEEDESGEFDPRGGRKNKRHGGSRSGRNNRGGGSSVSSNGSSKRSFGWRSNNNNGNSGKNKEPTQPADPLSLVVLLVEPSSLRFELLSLDFDLTQAATTRGGGKQRRRMSSRKQQRANNENGGPPKLSLTVDDVLNQITPESLTEDRLKACASTPGSCKGLVDRNGTIHFGSASLEHACASRPLRTIDRGLSGGIVGAEPRQQRPLAIPTYSGEPHRDVLVGFFQGSSSGSSWYSNAEVTKAMELARPIFADPNVIGLMESNGYDLTGWKPAPAPKGSVKSSSQLSSSSSFGAASEANRALLDKPLRPPPRRKKTPWTERIAGSKTVLGLVAMLLATVVAWSLVAGVLHLLPSIRSDDGDDHGASPSGDGDRDDFFKDLPRTLEGYAKLGFDLARSWYLSRGDGGGDVGGGSGSDAAAIDAAIDAMVNEALADQAAATH